jgi:hypothetical protein
MITYLSRCYGGKASDTYITNHSGFLDNLSPGDMVMADKGFPRIKSEEIITVIPPRASAKQKQFTQEQLEDTQKIASVRIHVERVIQRLKIFRILTHRFEYSLLPHVNKILRVCAALVNLSAPILRSTSSGPMYEEEMGEDTSEQEGRADEEGQIEYEEEEEEAAASEEEECTEVSSTEDEDMMDFE